jgi:hypothetical protein
VFSVGRISMYMNEVSLVTDLYPVAPNGDKTLLHHVQLNDSRF